MKKLFALAVVLSLAVVAQCYAQQWSSGVSTPLPHAAPWPVGLVVGILAGFHLIAGFCYLYLAKHGTPGHGRVSFVAVVSLGLATLACVPVWLVVGGWLPFGIMLVDIAAAIRIISQTAPTLPCAG